MATDWNKVAFDNALAAANRGAPMTEVLRTSESRYHASIDAAYQQAQKGPYGILGYYMAKAEGREWHRPVPQRSHDPSHPFNVWMDTQRHGGSSGGGHGASGGGHGASGGGASAFLNGGGGSGSSGYAFGQMPGQPPVFKPPEYDWTLRLKELDRKAKMIAYNDAADQKGRLQTVHTSSLLGTDEDDELEVVRSLLTGQTNG